MCKPDTQALDLALITGCISHSVSELLTMLLPEVAQVPYSFILQLRAKQRVSLSQDGYQPAAYKERKTWLTHWSPTHEGFTVSLVNAAFFDFTAQVGLRHS